MTTMTATWTAVEGRARWNGEPLVYWVDMLVAELVEEFAPIEVWLFGSVARGDDDADGGLDMLVVLDHYDAADAVAWKRRAARAASVPAPFDVSFTNTERMAARRRLAGTIERAASREGVLKFRRA